MARPVRFWKRRRSTPLKGKRDRAILATFLHHGLRCEELCDLRGRDLHTHTRQGVLHLQVFGKGSKFGT
jgi:site-specific recombinase XerC